MDKKTININIIGVGKLGLTLLKALSQIKHIVISGICNQHYHKALQIVQNLKVGKPYQSIKQLPPCDITFIATPDDIIPDIANTLTQSSNLKKGSLVVHFSGLLSSGLLSPLREKKCHIASIHPMRSFSTLTDFTDTFCAIEGDKSGIEKIASIFNELGAKTFTIDAKDKAIYHTAGVFASNYLVTLYHSAQSCLISANISPKQSHQIITNLMQATLDNLIYHQTAKKCLTGPIQRGDKNTIEEHLRTLKDTPLFNLYRQLGQNTLPISELPEKINADLGTLLDDTCE